MLLLVSKLQSRLSMSMQSLLCCSKLVKQSVFSRFFLEELEFRSRSQFRRAEIASQEGPT